MGRKRNTKEINNIILYECCSCKKFKDSNAYENRSDNKSKLRSQCKECRNLESKYYHRTVRLRMTKEQALKDIDKGLIYKADPLISLKKYILRLTKSSARNRNKEHSLTIDDIILPKKCPILNKEFILGDFKYTYSVDRIDNNKGYIQGNIRIISNLANSMKRNATNEELLTFSKNIKKYIKI